MGTRLLTSAALSLALTVPLAAQANTAVITSYGPNCGPVLVGSREPISQGNGLFFYFTVTTEQESCYVLWMIGDATANIPIDPFFGTSFGCLLLQNSVFTQAHQAHDFTYTWARSAGEWWGTAYFQFAEIYLPMGGPISVKTTNALQVDRPL